ncbi:MAG: HmuY family protein [Cytophagales bacterium]|nr:HmuY family protein [Cytophagales bacterium]
MMRNNNTNENNFMFKLRGVLWMLIVVFMLGACTDEDEEPSPEETTEEKKPEQKELVSNKVDNLHAPQKGGIRDAGGSPTPISGPFAKFDFATNETVAADSKDWDIAFRGSTIVINGGAASKGSLDEPERTGKAAIYIASGSLDDVKEVDTSKLKQDSADALAIPAGSGNGWYSYAGPPTHVISAIAGKVLVIRTRDEKYAKVEILSYYKDAPETPDQSSESPYYTFRYVYQPNEGVTTF